MLFIFLIYIGCGLLVAAYFWRDINELIDSNFELDLRLAKTIEEREETLSTIRDSKIIVFSMMIIAWPIVIYGNGGAAR